MASLHQNLALMLTQQTLLWRFLAHVAGINVGLHMEKYNTHFDYFWFLFLFFLMQKCFVLESVESVVIGCSKKRHNKLNII